MYDFFLNLGTAIEDFFATNIAAALGAFFVVITIVLVLVLLKYFENK